MLNYSKNTPKSAHCAANNDRNGGDCHTDCDNPLTSKGVTQFEAQSHS
jgi:hypothetical protein